MPELIEAKAAFDRFDLDRSGKISLLELRGALKASEHTCANYGQTRANYCQTCANYHKT